MHTYLVATVGRHDLEHLVSVPLREGRLGRVVEQRIIRQETAHVCSDTRNNHTAATRERCASERQTNNLQRAPSRTTEARHSNGSADVRATRHKRAGQQQRQTATRAAEAARASAAATPHADALPATTSMNSPGGAESKKLLTIWTISSGVTSAMAGGGGEGEGEEEGSSLRSEGQQRREGDEQKKQRSNNRATQRPRR